MSCRGPLDAFLHDSDTFSFLCPPSFPVFAPLSAAAYTIRSTTYLTTAEEVDWAKQFEQVKGSIFFVLFTPIQDDLGKLQEVADGVKNIEDQAQREAMVSKGCSSTGFVCCTTESRLLIMTTANGLRHLFNASLPLTLETLRMFSITVVCDHQEETLQRNRSIAGDRKYADAVAGAVDSDKDIIILRLKKSLLKNYLDERVCARRHPALQICPYMPIDGTECMLVSWPPHLHRMVSMGSTVSSTAVDMPNAPVVLEVDMRTEDCSSGAPLFNPDGQVIGMLRGSLNRSRSIFVAGSHLQDWIQAAHDDWLQRQNLRQQNRI